MKKDENSVAGTETHDVGNWQTLAQALVVQEGREKME
jgi:hypothetical protein